jgi:plastocyanin
MNRMAKIFSIFILCISIMAVFSMGLPAYAQQAKPNEQGGAIEGVVDSPYVKRYQALVYIGQMKGDFPPPKQDLAMSQKNMVFAPHILPVLKGTTVDFTNDDTVAHNVFAPPGAAAQFNLGLYGPGVKKTVTFDTLGEVPLLCNVHPEMLGYVIVLQNPYFSLTDSDGKFQIKNVPPGTYQLKVWNEKIEGAPQQVVVTAGKTTAVEFKGLKKRSD